MRRSRNFLRYTNIRQRQKSERCGGDTQAKCPILPDNLRLHFLFFPRWQERTLQSVIPQTGQAGGVQQVSSGGIDAAVRQARPPDPSMSYFPPPCSALKGVRKAQGAVWLDAAP